MLIPIITGPTGVGKTDISIEIYNNYNVEIISADAFQVYKYMDIGTSKPDINRLNQIPHHLINILEPDEHYSAGLFVEHAEKIIKSILNKGKLPLIVGGTALYIDRLVNGIFNDIKVNDDIRTRIIAEGEEKGYEYLYKKLNELDSIYATKINKNDHVRIIRALEVYEKFKKPYSAVLIEHNSKPKFRYKVFILQRDRKSLYKLVEERIDNMFNYGWIEEVAKLLNKGYSVNEHAFKAIGYREIADLIYGKNLLEETKNCIKKRTRNFVKRQCTFFKKLSYIEKVYDKNLIDNFFKKYYKSYEKSNLIEI